MVRLVFCEDDKQSASQRAGHRASSPAQTGSREWLSSAARPSRGHAGAPPRALFCRSRLQAHSHFVRMQAFGEAVAAACPCLPLLSSKPLSSTPDEARTGPSVACRGVSCHLEIFPLTQEARTRSIPTLEMSKLRPEEIGIASRSGIQTAV